MSFSRMMKFVASRGVGPMMVAVVLDRTVNRCIPNAILKSIYPLNDIRFE